MSTPSSGNALVASRNLRTLTCPIPLPGEAAAVANQKRSTL
jgi:hypothetical protein